MPNSVRYFASTLSGAPSLSGTAGTLISVLTACLQDGFGSVTLTSLQIASNVATATCSTGHGFVMQDTVGPVIRLAGANPPALNTDWRVTVTDATHFTFATSGLSDQTATGTITAKLAPLGWSVAYSGTNTAAYRPDAVTSNRLYLRVADAGTGAATYARVRGYETMSDVDTGTGLFPTDAQVSGGLYWPKSSTENSTARAWRLIGDHAGFLYATNYSSTYWLGQYVGDFPSQKAADAFATLIMGATSSSLAGVLPILSASASAAGHYVARTYAQTGGSIAVRKIGHPLTASVMAEGGSDYPAGPGNQFYAGPVQLWESATVFRGILPGIYNPLHSYTDLTHDTFQTNLTGLAGRTLLIHSLLSGSSVFAAIDLTGPWR